MNILILVARGELYSLPWPAYAVVLFFVIIILIGWYDKRSDILAKVHPASNESKTESKQKSSVLSRSELIELYNAGVITEDEYRKKIEELSK